MKNVLLISGHPNLDESVASATIINEIENAMPDIEIRKLDKLYPAYQFDIKAEQDAILKADLIIWQFPFSWYSVPGLLKLWIDEVFLHGFSHGSKGQLSGKKLLLSFTTGAPAEVYSSEGSFRHTIEDYLPQFETTALLCNLDYISPVYTNGISYTSRDNDIKKQKQIDDAKGHALRLISVIKEICN